MPHTAGKITRFTKKEIDKLFDTAQRQIKNSALDILLGPRQKYFGRILIVISRKVGNAPKRNKIRRRLKSIFYKEKLYEKPYDCIVIVKKEAVTLSFEALEQLLQSTYSKKEDSGKKKFSCSIACLYSLFRVFDHYLVLLHVVIFQVALDLPFSGYKKNRSFLQYGKFLNAYFHATHSLKTVPKSFCLFESFTGNYHSKTVSDF